MRRFDYARTSRAGEAVDLVAGEPTGAFVAGGTDLLNLMKDGAEAPDLVVDINDLPLSDVEVVGEAARERLRIGALARLADVAAHPRVSRELPVLTEALLATASPQVRNMATVGGNLMQRTRCWYFRDPDFACNKRAPGSGCPAQEGQNRWHAILGGSDHCIAVHPSDLAVALRALDATVHTLGPGGRRAIAIGDFHREPGAAPERETALRHGELITAVEVPLPRRGTRSGYLKVRDRATFEFAVVSAAAVLRMDGRTVRDIALAFGGIATRPWRSAAAEDALRGRRLTDDTVAAAGRALVAGARPRTHNAFKVELVQRALHEVLGALGDDR
ncbi:FAD binding domain-containing protein [Streptomyces radicis]|uniref:Xanthine dehydrogenase family protein subunit M n=1 Tax=Streptomyces radicis TaxID=1750517 RepID=A0A3A9W9J5_9ACTN|nr:xanthine dehydrogenase family protein subunit M [Streptomyces radicis]RKN04236.1 xanthine dehydrogenase family protein subunit M [Streptomyces radicis]RKN14754.1 xanthine dehydrogenase family protein subunit M [Streptomyces radicis]